MSNYLVDLLTPDKVVLQDQEVKNIWVSTVKGEINILENHTHFITKLFTGLLTLQTNDGVKKLSVENGICKILRNKITILSNSSLSKEQVDVKATKDEMSEIHQRLQKTDLMSKDAINSLYDRLDVLESHLKL